jgi:valyl-tRNA synthetase
MTEMQPRYDPKDVEARWYLTWERDGRFKPDPDSRREPFVITIPPPNVTGELHLGHALTYGIEDLIGRFKRMQGFDTLILPGMDHAGIATQNVVEKQLAREGLTRDQLGRDRFLERVWQWKEQYADNIRQQFRALGCAFDWSRERFTMDPEYADAVLEFFIRLFDEGKIYRGWRVINWCPRCRSAISDIEVHDDEREDSLYYLRYPLKDGSRDIIVATVRPETILGDVAVAVNPGDDRFKDLVGETAVLPLLGRELPIIADEMVDTGFGTGAVKVTPAHDFADFEVAERHHLDAPIAIAPDARITEVGGPYQGETVSEARASVLRDLEAGGYLVKIEPHRHLVPTCDRCGTLLEPLLSEQWFMHMTELAEPAMQVVREGRVRFTPNRWADTYLDWLERIRPWTLSRQLWWGHRIPVYYCDSEHATAAKSWPKACKQCDGSIVRQDPDVLDTWFSSALWPFATLGWPRDTTDLRAFYPTSFMNTSSQILYLWIARMVMTGIKFMDEVPFQDVLINPTILNKHGQRMSKSLGTGIDPLDLVDQFGADALRFGLITSGSTHQQEIRFSPERVEQARNFANKVWNVARAILTNQGSEQGELRLTLADRWILSRLSQTVAAVTSDLERFEFSGAGGEIFDFVWSELADWYLEIAKLRLYDEHDLDGRYTARAVTWAVLSTSVRLLHPYMPFLTEEIWAHLRASGSAKARALSQLNPELPDSIMTAPWPVPGVVDGDAVSQMDHVTEIIRAVRAARSENRVEASKYISAVIVALDEGQYLRDEGAIISRLARLQPLQIVGEAPRQSEQQLTLLIGEVTVYLPLNDMSDVEVEQARLSKEMEGAVRALSAVGQKLANPDFTARAPAHVVERERGRETELQRHVDRIQDRLKRLRSTE